MQGGKLPFLDIREENVDRFAAGMMTGGKFEDGSGRGFVPQQTTGDGACFFHGIANAASGMKCKGRRGVLAYALPIRFACLKTALASMEAVLSMDGWGCALPSPHFSEFLLPNLSSSLPFLGMWDSVVGNLAPCQQLQMRRLRKRRTLHVSCVLSLIHISEPTRPY